MAVRHVCSFIAVLLLQGALAQLSLAQADEKRSRRERFEGLKAEYDRKFEEFKKAAQKSTGEADAAEVRKLRPTAKDYCNRFMALANENAADDVACDALVWVVEHHDQRESLQQLEEAIGLIAKHHLATPKLKEIIPALAYSHSKPAVVLAEALIEKGGNREVRGYACMFSAIGRYAQFEGKFEDKDDKHLAEIRTLLLRVQKDYPDIQLDNKRFGRIAEGLLFELAHLIPGKVAPDIEGADLTGKKMKLSDHRGKVVVLVFWGSWCGPCMGEVPYLRKLMASFRDRPFTVVGVNSGDTREKAAKAIRDEKMTWPVFLDGEDGPIVERWAVLHFPTVYVLDAKGVIRLKQLSDQDEFEKIIAELVKQAEGK